MFPEATIQVYLDFQNLELHATTGMKVNLTHLDATMEVVKMLEFRGHVYHAGH